MLKNVPSYILTQKLFLQISIGSITSLGLLLIFPNHKTIAQPSQTNHTSAISTATEFKQIPQPLWLKAIVTASGFGLIGLETWWFIFSQQKSQTANSLNGVQEINITVDGGYKPNRIVVSAGQTVRLNFLRRDPSSCLEKVVFPDFNISRELILDQSTPIEFTPRKPGKYFFACGMNMFRGTVEVKPTKS